MLLTQLKERIDCTAAHQPKVSGVSRDTDSAHALDQSVEAVGRDLFETRLALLIASLRVHHIEALAPALDQLMSSGGSCRSVSMMTTASPVL
jgi:hypothetical protein